MSKKTVILVLCIFTFQCIVAQDFRFKKVSKEEVAEVAHPREPDANAAILFRSVRIGFKYDAEKGFVLKTDYHERIKIYNSDGNEWATKEISLYGESDSREEFVEFKGYTYNLVDGKVEDEKVRSSALFEDDNGKDRRTKKFTMPNIQDGSVIEYKYSIVSPYISLVDKVRFQEGVPVNKVEMQFDVPEYMKYAMHSRGVLPFNIKERSQRRFIDIRYQDNAIGKVTGGDWKVSRKEITENVFEISLADISSIKKEPFSGNLDNYRSSLEFELSSTNFPNSPYRNYATTWDDVALKIFKSDNFGKELGYTRYFEKDIDNLIKGVTSDKEKLFLVYNFVQSKMSWNNYYGVYTDLGVKNAYDQGVGNIADINLMLAAMLKHVGLDVAPVLLSTKANGIPFLPTRTGFNYVIAATIIDGKLILLDAADKAGVPNVLKPELLNWKGRMVTADGASALVDLYPVKTAVHNSMMNLKISDDFILLGSVKNRFTGHYARSERMKYGDLSENEQLSKLDESYSNIEALDVSFKDIENRLKPLSLEYNFESEDVIDEAGDKMYISPLVHLANEKNYFLQEKRDHPVDFIHSWSDKYMVSLEIPEGYEVVSIPEDIVINLPNNLGSYRYGVTQASGKINIALQNTINAPIIEESYYNDLKVYFNMIIEKESEKIVLKRI